MICPSVYRLQCTGRPRAFPTAPWWPSWQGASWVPCTPQTNHHRPTGPSPPSRQSTGSLEKLLPWYLVPGSMNMTQCFVPGFCCLVFIDLYHIPYYLSYAQTMQHWVLKPDCIYIEHIQIYFMYRWLSNCDILI